VQESFHASELFRILDTEETNFLSNLSSDQFKVLRKRVIGLILATDMAKHMTDGGALKNLCETNEIKEGKNVGKLFTPTDPKANNANQQLILESVMHSCDVS
jgi:hypothetical protein